MNIRYLTMASVRAYMRRCPRCHSHVDLCASVGCVCVGPRESQWGWGGTLLKGLRLRVVDSPHELLEGCGRDDGQEALVDSQVGVKGVVIRGAARAVVKREQYPV